MESALQIHPRPTSLEDLLATLERERSKFPKRLGQCADFIIENSDQVALGTVAEIAAGAGVSPSAMLRFAQSLGFEGYSDMQRLFRASIKRELPDYSSRLKQLQASGAGSPSALLAEFVERAGPLWETLAGSVDPRTLDVSVEQLARADLIHIKGMRRALPRGGVYGICLEKMDIPAVLHQNTGGLGASNALRPGDAAIAVTFAPYSAETLGFIKLNKRAGPADDGCHRQTLGGSHRREHLPDLRDRSGFRRIPFAFRDFNMAISLAVSVGARRESTK